MSDYGQYDEVALDLFRQTPIAKTKGPIPRREVVVPVVGVTFRDGLEKLNVDNGTIYSLRVGEPRIDFQREPENPADPNAIAIYIRSRHVGYLPRDLAARVELPDTWAGRIVEIFRADDWGIEEKEDREIVGLRIRMIPFDQKSCGCYVNFGGWTVRSCADHAAEEPPRSAWEGFSESPPGWDDDPRVEQNREYESW